MTVMASELKEFDDKIFAAVNGDAGGTWAPAAVITLGGSGLAVSGPLGVSGTLAVTSATGTMTNTTFTLAGTAKVRLGSGTSMEVDSNGTVNVNSGGVVTLKSGSSTHVNADASFVIDSAAAFNISSGGFLTVLSGGGILMNGASTIEMAGTSSLTFDTGTVQLMESGSFMQFRTGSAVDLNSGSNLTIASGAAVSLGAGATISMPASGVTLTGSGLMACSRAFTDVTCPHAMHGDSAGGMNESGYALGDTGHVFMMLHLPRHSTITSITVYVQSQVGTYPPTQFPFLELFSTPAGSLTHTLVATVTDTSGSLGAFTSVHALTLDSAALGGGLLASETTSYILKLTGDLTGLLQASGPHITGTVDRVNVY